MVADVLQLETAKVRNTMSLGGAGADELDFVEIVLSLEKHFHISIPYDAAKEMSGSGDLRKGLKKVTMSKLAELVESRKHQPLSDDDHPFIDLDKRNRSGPPKRDDHSRPLVID